MPPFTELPRACVPETWASGVRGSRKLRKQKEIEEGRGVENPGRKVGLGFVGGGTIASPVAILPGLLATKLLMNCRE